MSLYFTADGAQENAGRNFTILDFPGASDTTALGINNEGEIVGRYNDALGRHGYLRSEDGFTTIDVPGVVFTVASGLNDHGTIVGNYISADGVRHVFQLRHDHFVTIDPPGRLVGAPVGINNRGVIVGSCVGQDGHTHGFVFQKGNFTTVDAPNALNTFSNAINDEGEIVGGYQSRADLKFRGYILRGDEFTIIDRPEVSLIITIGINNEGSVVGSWAGADGVGHGYLLRDGKFTAFDPPNSVQAPGEANGHEPHGINEHGQIVGYFRGIDGRQHGYLLNLREREEELSNGVFYFAQAGGGVGFSTTISLSNPSTSKSVTGTITFIGSDGQPLTAVVPNATVPFMIPPGGRVKTNTNAQGAVRSGYARISSSDAVFAKAVYSLTSFAPVTVGPSTPNAFSFRAPISRDASKGVETGIAIVNVSSSAVHVVISLLDSTGKPIRAPKASVVLSPGEQLSRLSGELFSGLPDNFAGKVRIIGLSPLPSQSLVVTVVQLGPNVIKAVEVTPLSKRLPAELDDLE